MRHARLIGVLAVSAGITATLCISSRLLRAQNSASEATVQPAVTPPPYNPYPPGILPSDIVSERARVEREIAGIFNNYLAQSKALPPVTYTGNPPIIQGDGYHAMRVLGGLLQYDLTMSPFQNFACASCHMPYAAFSGPIPSVNLTMVAYPGSYAFRARVSDFEVQLPDALGADLGPDYYLLAVRYCVHLRYSCRGGDV